MPDRLRMSDPLVRKLHGWELDHLRDAVEEQRAEIERLSADNDRLRRELANAEANADLWRDAAARDLDVGESLGITRDGRVHLITDPTNQPNARPVQ